MSNTVAQSSIVSPQSWFEVFKDTSAEELTARLSCSKQLLFCILLIQFSDKSYVL